MIKDMFNLNVAQQRLEADVSPLVRHECPHLKRSVDGFNVFEKERGGLWYHRQ